MELLNIGIKVNLPDCRVLKLSNQDRDDLLSSIVLAVSSLVTSEIPKTALTDLEVSLDEIAKNGTATRFMTILRHSD